MAKDRLKAALIGRTIRRVEELKIQDLRAFKNFDGKTAYKVLTENVTMVFTEEVLQALLDGVTVGETNFEYELDRVMTMKQINELLIGKTLVESYQWEDDEPEVSIFKIRTIEPTEQSTYTINGDGVRFTRYELQQLAVNGEFNSTTDRYGKEFKLRLTFYDK